MAICLFNKYQEKQKSPLFQELTLEDVERDNLQFIIRRFAAWLANFDLPCFHDKNFEPRGAVLVAGTFVAYIEAGTKRKYVERLKLVLKDKFLRHLDWAEQNVWWTQLLVNFDTEAKRKKMRLQGDNGVDNQSIKCLCKRNLPGKVSMLRNMEKFQAIELVNLTYICRQVHIFHAYCCFLCSANLF